MKLLRKLIILVFVALLLGIPGCIFVFSPIHNPGCWLILQFNTEFGYSEYLRMKGEAQAALDSSLCQKIPNNILEYYGGVPLPFQNSGNYPAKLTRSECILGIAKLTHNPALCTSYKSVCTLQFDGRAYDENYCKSQVSSSQSTQTPNVSSSIVPACEVSKAHASRMCAAGDVMACSSAKDFSKKTCDSANSGNNHK